MTMKNNYEAVSLRPFSYLSPSVHTKVSMILLVLLPQVLMLFLTHSWNSLWILLCSSAASFSVVGIECAFSRKKVFDWVFALVRGLIIGLLIPSGYPLFPVFLITLCVLLVSEFFLGGFSHSWVNPVALTVAVCWILSTQLFPSFSLQMSDLQGRNAALALIQNGTVPVIGLDPKITAFFNKTVFSLFGVSIPEGYVSLFWDSHSLIPAFRFNLLTLVASIFLISFDIVSALIPSIYLLVYCLSVRFVAPLFYRGIVGQGDMLLALLTSGTLFCTIFLLQWYGTTPITVAGKVCYGILAGIVAFLVIGVGDSGAGSVFTVLVINVVVPFIHAVETLSEKHYLNAVLLPRVQSFKDGQNA